MSATKQFIFPIMLLTEFTSPAFENVNAGAATLLSRFLG